MPGLLKNIHTFFSDTRTRNIFLSTFIILLMAIVLGLYIFHKRTTSLDTKATLSRVPSGIKSIPGNLNPTDEYAKLQEQENVEKAQVALKQGYRGKSVIPTLIQSQEFGEGMTMVEQNGQGGLYFSTLAQRERQSGIVKDLWIDKLLETSCSGDSIQEAIKQGVLLEDLVGLCSCKQLKDSGFDAKQFREQGFSAEQLKQCGFSAAELRAAGFSAAELRAAGFSAAELRAAGFSAAELRAAGFGDEALREASSSEDELQGAAPSESKLVGTTNIPPPTSCMPERVTKLRDSGVRANEIRQLLSCSDDELIAGGFNSEDLRQSDAQLIDSLPTSENSNETLEASDDYLSTLQSTQETTNDGQSMNHPSETSLPPINGAESANLETLLAQQTQQFDEQQLQQQIQQRQAAISSQVNQLVSDWGPTSVQYYVAGSGDNISQIDSTGQGIVTSGQGNILAKTGDIMFAVLDTAVNSDEPGPVLATIISGELQGAKLIGSLSLPNNAQKLILSFNTLSLPEASQTISINAVAIDPNTARTALSDQTDNHYLLRYGSLFGSAFLEGFGRAFATQGTRVQNNDFGVIIEEAQRTFPENVAIGFGEVGRRVGNQMESVFNRPPTVEVYSGTGIGILFTSDVTSG